MSEKKALKYFEKRSWQIDFASYEKQGHTIHYAITGTDSMPLILFVHGAPGSWENFKKIMIDSGLQKNSRMISVDRPGYGYSDFGESVTSISLQAELLADLLNEDQLREGVVLVGHSYGGPVVAKMAMDTPEKIKALILVAPAISPALEPMYAINQYADMASFRWLLPKVFRVANDEKMSHVEELKKILGAWQQIDMPVTTLHGEKDKLVPFENTEFANRVLVNSPEHRIVSDKGNHLIPFNRPEMIIEALEYYLD